METVEEVRELGLMEGESEVDLVGDRGVGEGNNEGESLKYRNQIFIYSSLRSSTWITCTALHSTTQHRSKV